MDIYLNFGYDLILLLYFYVAQDIPTESSLTCPVSFLCPFVTPLPFFFLSTFLLSDTIRCSRLIVYISWPSPRMSYFFKELQFLLENGFETNIWTLGVTAATGESLLLGNKAIHLGMLTEFPHI